MWPAVPDRNDRYLSEYFEVDGIDIGASYLEVARERNSKGHYRCGDMRDFRLDRRYDVVVCRSIGHVETMENLLRALKCFREHLTSPGIVLIEPRITPQEWEPNSIRHDVSLSHQGMTIVRMCHSAVRGRVSQLTWRTPYRMRRRRDPRARIPRDGTVYAGGDDGCSGAGRSSRLLRP